MIKCKRIPTKIVNNALEILELYIKGEILARKSNKHSYLILNVGRNYRLINKGKKWELITHQEYNKSIDK